MPFLHLFLLACERHQSGVNTIFFGRTYKRYRQNPEIFMLVSQALSNV